MKKWLKRNTHSLAGKTVAISGATGGIGRELCAHLCELGASLLLLDRNEEKSQALRDTLKTRFPLVNIEGLRLDLEDMSTVKAVADTLSEAPPDYLILNAGAYSIPRHKCETGYDNVYQINFVSPYYLARRLLPLIEVRGGKVVAVGSIAHDYSHIDKTDIDFSSRAAASKVYGNAKRYLMYALLGLGSPSISVTHPGITLTGITAHYPKVIFAMIKYPMKVIFMKPRKASLCILAGIFEESGTSEWIGPRLFGVWGIPRKKRLLTASSDERREICGIADKIYSELVNK